MTDAAENEESTVEEQLTDYFNMSDEEAMKEPIVSESNLAQEFDSQEETLDAEADETSEAEAGEAEASSEDVDGSDNENTEIDSTANAAAEDIAEETPAESTNDSENFFNAVTAPFKANGKEMSVTDPDDVVQLMQMGANYNKKMAALKPNLKLLKLLEKNALLSEDKLSFLIDIDKKDPKAIAKLLKDSNIDPLDIDQDADADYAPSKHTVDDAEIVFDEIISSIQDTPTFSTTLDIVGDKWDDKSKLQVRESPQLLKLINDQVANGIYEIISQQVDKERMFGRLDGMSDLEAYTATGDAIDAKGGFAHLAGNANASKPDPVKAEKAQQSAQSQSKETNRKDKKRAASPTKVGAPKTEAKADYSPLALSDDEFEKQFNSKFL